jgi:hypothetical protein
LINVKHLAALLGFLFVAMWILTNFGYAVLCLLGAGLFYAAAAFMQGDLDIGEVQSRLGVGGPGQPSAGTAARSRMAR